MARENIVLHKGNEYTFGRENIGKYKIVAHIPNSDCTNKENVFTSKTIEVILPTSDTNIDIMGTTNTTFLLGTDIQYFSILYKYTGNSEYDISTLNNAAITYIKDWNNIASENEKIEIGNTESEQPIFFGVDGQGIYAILQKNQNYADQYHESIITTINGQEYIKAYVKGTCEIIDVNYQGINNMNMISSIAYPFTFKYSNDSDKLVTYLFINSGIRMLESIDTSNNSFVIKSYTTGYNHQYKYHKPTNYTDLIKNSSIEQLFQNNNNISDFIYLIKPATTHNSIKTISDSSNTDEPIMIISEGTNREIIIPETVKYISHFYGGSNATNIILPNSLIEIREYAFYGTSIEGNIQLRNINESKLSYIDAYAFKNINNTNIFAYDLNDDGQRHVIKQYLINKCKYTEDVIEDIFENYLSKDIYTVIPNILSIGEMAFSNIATGASIKNMIISNIDNINKQCFANNYFTNTVIPKKLVYTPNYKEKSICYLPNEVIIKYYNYITGKTTPYFNTQGNYSYENYSTNLGLENYADKAKIYQTFNGLSGSVNWYIIEDEVYTGPTTLSEE